MNSNRLIFRCFWYFIWRI